jgi:beta-glucosidase
VGCLIDKYLPAIPEEMLRPADGSDRPGLLLEYRNGAGFEGEPVETRVVRRSTALYMGRFSEAVDPAAFSVRYAGAFTPTVSGVHAFGLLSSEPARLFIDDALAIDLWTERPAGDAFFGRGSSEERFEIELEAGSPYLFRIEFEKSSDEGLCGLQFGMRPPQSGDTLEEAVACAEAADAVVLVIGTNAEWETEGHDRASLALPGAQDELVRRVLAANPQTVVVLNTGSPVELPWLDDAPALIQSWFPGQEYGLALCDLLFGRVCPSGRMPTTWPRRIEDTPAHAFYPGAGGHAPYGEGLAIGYRHYDAAGIEPLIAFGHGRSYTEFAYGPLEMPERIAAGEPLVVELPVANAGDMTGQEVVQLYVHPEDPPVERPPAELRGFAKIEIAPNRTEVVRIELAPRAFAHWDEAGGEWSVAPGRYEIRVGASSRDIRSRAWLEITP